MLKLKTANWVLAAVGGRVLASVVQCSDGARVACEPRAALSEQAERCGGCAFRLFSRSSPQGSATAYSFFNSTNLGVSNRDCSTNDCSTLDN